MLIGLSFRRTCLAVIAMGVAVSSCASDSGVARVINVPGDEPTIQQAVDKAHSGDMVLIADGTYNEAVKVSTDGVTLRGMNRNNVILDGNGKYSNGITVTANSVTIQNMTLHSYQQNAVIFTGVLPTGSGEYAGSEKGSVIDGYRVDHVTAYNNGLYGVYAFASRNGIIENSYASGHPDSGFYVGQCRPCNAVLQNNIAENNAIGYYGTNASGKVFVVHSVFRNNRLGIAPNSQKAEQLSPQEETVVAGNFVDNNDNPNAPKIPKGFFAAGIAIGGGTKNTVMKNRVTNHAGAGIIVLTFNEFEPVNNVVTENILEKNGTDLVYSVGTSGGNQNCFSRNVFTSSWPKDIESVMQCGKVATASSGLFALPVAPPGPNFQNVEKPGPQPTLENPTTAPFGPVVSSPVFPNIKTIAVP